VGGDLLVTDTDVDVLCKPQPLHPSVRRMPGGGLGGLGDPPSVSEAN